MQINGMISVTEFLSNIEEIANKHGKNSGSYLDAIIHYCELNGIEIETAGEIIKSNSAFKSKLQMEAEDLNFLPKTKRLPI